MESIALRVTILPMVVLTIASSQCAFGQHPKELTNSFGMKLTLVPKGTFMMGSPHGEKKRSDSELQHEVTISRDYYPGITEVTQGQFETVMRESPSYFKGDKIQGDSCGYPVEQVSWKDAVEFCRRLSELPEGKKEGRAYRLPTEAEWEHACRAGSTTAYSFGDLDEQVGDYAWCAKLANRQTHPVGQKRPNAWGLYDMHGNVGEWCQDWYGDYPPRKNVVDPSGPPSGEFRVIRGGSWFEAAAKCRSASRLADWANAKSHACGFRVVLPISE